MILEGFPEACKQVCKDKGLVPLEYAVNAVSLADFEVIEALVRAFPKALMVVDSTHGIFLMHGICARHALTETFVLMVKELCPEVFLLADKAGCVPLHYVLQYSVLEDETQQAAALALFRACPEAASVAATDGRFPLHCSGRHLNARVTQGLVVANPEAVVTKAGVRGRTPLHVLLETRWNFSLEVAKVLVAARPNVLMVTDEQGNTPLSIAVGTRADLTTVEWLINARPEAAVIAKNDGRIPLHIAVRDASTTLELVRMLYQAWPGGARQADSEGMLPLALAVAEDRAQETIEFLFEAYPDAALIKDNGGRLPLHHAVARPGRHETFQFLFGTYPEAGRITDNQGTLPVHRAVQVGSLATVAALVAAWPDCLKEPTTEGEIPLILALKHHKLNESIVHVLLELWLDSVKCTNQVGDLPIHMVSRWTNGADDMNLSDVCARARFLIDQWPESLRKRNRKGALPLHVLLSCITDKEQLFGRKRKRDDAVTGQLELFGLFVSKCPESVEMVDGEGSIPLIVASQNDSVSLDAVDFLTKASMNVLPTSCTGRFPANEFEDSEPLELHSAQDCE